MQSRLVFIPECKTFTLSNRSRRHLTSPIVHAEGRVIGCLSGQKGLWERLKKKFDPSSEPWGDTINACTHGLPNHAGIAPERT